MMKIDGGVLLVFLLVPAIFMSAQETPVLVVTGAKVAQDIEETVEAVEVVTKEAIEAMGAKTVAEVMENIPGVVIFDHPQATVMMQGFEGAYVKVLIDGIEISGDVGGATPVSMLPVSDIERIEIIRGASSVLYGSDAMGGVINIITKKPEPGKFSAQIRQEFASNLRYYGEGYLGYRNKLFGLSLGGSFDSDDGKIVQQRNSRRQMIDLYEVAAARLGSLRGNAAWYHPGGELEVYGSWMHSLIQVSADIENGYDFINHKIEGGIKEAYHLSDFALVDGFFSFRQLDYHADRNNYSHHTSSAYADSLFRDIEGEVRFSWEPAISHALLFGINAQREALESDSFAAEKSIIMASVFVQDTWNIGGADRLRVVPGLRFDYRPPNDSGEEHIYKLSPKLSFRYDPTEELILRFSYGMGFKTPSLKQNYWFFFHPAPYNFLITGNPNLKPETSHGFNLSADYSVTKQFTVTAASYFNYIFDLIDTIVVDENPGAALNQNGEPQNYLYIYQYRNVGRAITAGGDLSLRFNSSRFKAALSYNYTLAKEYDEAQETYIDLASRVPHQVSANGSYTIPVIETTAQVRANWNSPQLISYADKTYTPDYLMLTVRIAKTFFNEKLEVYGGIQNVLDNIHFIKSTEDQNQADYYGLRDGIIFNIGVNFKW
ncbi:MAG: TonB-dependent receptor [Treponema sp.]|jgi:outer membrane receptor for ferrienterochelin and colicins|nr:TonB-dependent receptor [Treponema sp.]